MRTTCDRCGSTIEIAERGRVRHYCSAACRQAAYRARALPVALTHAARWVRHINKRPVTVAGGPASSTDPNTWATYDEARASDVGDGLGFALGDGFACLDLDGCLIDGKPDATAVRILRECRGAYVEVSPSGRGLHVWGFAPESKGMRREGVEAYSSGRYVTVTGSVYRAGELVDLSHYFT